MKSIQTFVRHHRFSTFLALTFVLTWVPWLTVAALLGSGRPPSVSALMLLGGFGPLFAAVIVAVLGGDGRAWMGNLVDVRASPAVWLSAVLVPVGLYAVALGLFVLAGGTFDSAGVLPLAAVPAVVFATLLRGGLEEPGWRGLALPVLQRRVGAFPASVVIGIVWAVWHVPLFVMPGSSQAGTPFALYAAVVVGISVVATWLYNAADGRVLVPVVFHTLSNAVSVTTATGVVGDGVRSQVVLLLVVWAFAGLLVWRYGSETLSDGPLPDGGLSFGPAGGRGSVRGGPGRGTEVERSG